MTQKLIIGDFDAHHTSWNPKLNLKYINKTSKSLFKMIQIKYAVNFPQTDDKNRP